MSVGNYIKTAKTIRDNSGKCNGLQCCNCPAGDEQYINLCEEIDVAESSEESQPIKEWMTNWLMENDK
jgi:hypothetical protein